ncbi:MAG: hypothetical protein O8C59_02720 [Candidatus Methanoperedens sp.]|nr:hypothetical protein [Candidatus Methanoperedens sp.]
MGESIGNELPLIPVTFFAFLQIAVQEIPNLWLYPEPDHFLSPRLVQQFLKDENHPQKYYLLSKLLPVSRIVLWHFL